MGANIRILHVDDEEIVCAAIEALIRLEPGMTVVGNAGQGEMAIAKARALRPDVILLDLRLAGQQGVDLIDVLLQDNPEVRIVILTAYADDHEVAAAFRAGAVGYVLKTQAVSDLIRAIAHACQGLSSVPPRIAKIMLQTLNPPARPAPLAEVLSAAEIRVLTQVARGLQNKEIARHLGISRPTVHAHISHILTKLQLKNRTQAAVYAVKQGFASFDLAEAQVFDWPARVIRS